MKKEFCIAEFVCSAQNKLTTYPSLKPINKNRQEDMKLLLIQLNVTVFLGVA